MAKIPILDDILVEATNGQNPKYGRLVMRVYLRVLPLILTKASPFLFKGVWQAIRGEKGKRKYYFLEGTKVWAEDVKRITRSEVMAFNEVKAPEIGHMIFLNHVNEMDFPFDCLVLKRPFLANQVIKKTLFAYWWMKAMGSEVFDNSKAMTVAVSVKNLLSALKDSSFIVYPEGRNTYTEEIQPLKKGMIKLAYDHKIPIYLVLKSGIASYQFQQKGNTIGYWAVGIFEPSQFENYEVLQVTLFQAMKNAKAHLDGLTQEFHEKRKAA